MEAYQKAFVETSVYNKIVIIVIITTIKIIIKCFPAHDELGTCRTSLTASISAYLIDKYDCKYQCLPEDKRKS